MGTYLKLFEDARHRSDSLYFKFQEADLWGAAGANAFDEKDHEGSVN